MTFDPTTAQPETPAFDPNTAMPDGTPPTRAVVRQAVQVKPDTAAEVARLAKRYPAPYETIERNVDDFRLFDAADGIAEQLASAPPVEGAFRANARLAAMAHDDVPTLTKLASAMSDAARYIVSAPGAKRGLAGDAVDAAKTVGLGATVGVGKAIFDVTAVVYDALGADSWAEDMRYRARRAGEAMDYFGMDAEGSTAKGVKAGLQSAGTNLAMLPVGLERALFSTAQSAATAVAAAMGTSVGAAAYNEARDKGKDKVQAAIYGIPQGTFEFVFERMPAAKLFGDLASNASLMQTLRNQALTEGWTEQLTTLAQDFNEWMNMNPEKTLGEFIAERPDAAYQTFIATLVGVGVQTTTIKAIDKVVEKASDQRLQFQQDAFNDFLKMAGQSALRERSPEQFREVVQRVVEANPQGMQSIHVDAQVLNQLPEELLNQLPESVRAQIPDAALANGTVEIPMADVLTIAPGTPMEQVLNDHARMTPDAMSRADAQAAGDQAEVLKQEAARIVQQAQDQQAAQADYDQVQQLYAQQLADTGRVRPAVADMQAHWIASFYTAYGSRMGLTASQFQQRYPIRVLGAPSASTGPVMDQGKPGEITVEGYHFSTEDRPTITTAAYGTGLKGSGREMYQGAQDQRLRKRTYFYADKGTGIRPESGVGGRAHRVNLTNVYDSNADPLGLKQGGGGQLGFESRVLDAGFSGYLDRLEGTQPGQVIMLGDQTFTPELLGAQSFIETGKRVPAMPKTEPTWENYATGAPEQMRAQMERLQSKPAWGAYDFRIEGNALQYRKREGVYQQSVSSRVPWGKPRGKNAPAVENPLTERLQVGIEAFKDVPEALDNAVALLVTYPNYRPAWRLRTTESKVERFIAEVKANLLWLHDQVPAEIRERSKLWYDGANVIANQFAERYDVSLAQASAILAVNSPQTEWFTNVSRAERILDIWFNQQDFRWSNEMEATAAKILAKYSDELDEIRGKTLGELSGDSTLQAMWLRVFDESHNDRAHRIVTPEGTFGDWVVNKDGVTKTKTAWASFGHIAKSIEVIRDGSVENISLRLGNEHKVRSFYNNIFSPTDPAGDVTIDTHAVAAGLLRPLAGSGIEVEHNLGAGVSNALKGLSGTYGIYAEAYRQAAAERGILPREMQSITWEAVRGLYTDAFKSSAKAEEVEQAWRDFRAGKIDEAGIRARVLELSGGINEPNWWQSDRRPPTETWTSSYGGELSPVRVPGQPADTGASGDLAGGGAGGGAGQGGVLNQDGDLNGQRTGDRGGRYSSGSLAPLEGAPTVAGAAGPDPRLVAVAERYAADNGIDLRRQASYVQVDPERAARIAAAYEAMPHAPNDPAVREAYGNLIRQTMAQYLALKEAGYQFWFMDPAADPYQGNPWNAMRDLRANQSMAVFPTEAGFGTGGQVNIGLADPNGGPNIPPEAVLEALRIVGAEVEASAIFDSDTEPTLVVKLKKALTKEQGDFLSGLADQEAIAQRTDDDKGALFGKMAEKWGPFNPTYFVTPTGVRADEIANPLLADTGITWPYGSPDGEQRPVLANDLFRAVHDAFGHGLEGAGFRAQGEENAWQAHVRLFTGSAVGAITSETRGQNSWLNYGPHGQANQTAKVEDTIFADQKTGLMPEWTWTEGRAEDEQQVLEQRADQTKTPEFKAWFGDWETSRGDGVSAARVLPTSSRAPLSELPPQVMYHTTRNANFDAFEANRTTINSTTFGDVETSRAAIFFTSSVEDSNAYGSNSDGRVVKGAATMPVYLRAMNPLYLSEGIDEEDAQKLIDAGLSSRFVYNGLGHWSMFDDQEGRDLVEVLRKAGYDSVVFNDENPITGDSFEAWAVFDPEQIKSAIGNDGSFDANDPSILSQGPRGTFNPRTLELVLNPNANLSTWFHETGHFFLEVMADIASQPGAPAQVVDDFNTFLKWAGVKGAAAWNAMDLDGKRAYHERWAESVEQYVMEGKVPNKELQPLMRRFAAWLKSVYGSIQKMLQMRGAEDAPAQLNDDIRRVMDRLLATDEQIAQANETAGLMPDPTADAEAAERLAKRSTADLKWAVRARDQVIAKLRKQAAAIEKDLREQVTVEVDQMPEMRAKAALDALKVAPEYAAMLAEHKAARKAAEAQVTAEVRAALLAENPDAKGLVKGQLLMKNKRDIANKVDAAMIKWDTANPAPKRPVNATDADVATIADSFGFESVDAMMQAIDAFGSRKDAIDGLTQQRMLEEHGDLVDERAIADAANEAVHNEARARSLATELRTQREMLIPRAAKLTAPDLPDTKAVDADGKPMLVYHGTDKEFDTFAGGMFTSTRGRAENYAMGSKGRVLEVYLNITNPMPWRDAFGKSPEEIKAAGFDGTIQFGDDGSIMRAVVVDASQVVQPVQATNARGAKITTNALLDAAKQFAANVVGRTPLADLTNRAWQHTAAERRAGQRWQQATAAGKTQEAVQAKQDQMLNHAAAKAAIDAKAEMGKILEFFKRVVKGNDEKVVEKGRDPDIVNAARAVLRAYGIETGTTKTAEAYLETLQRNDPDTHAVVAPMVAAATQNAQPIQALTFDELLALHEEVQAMWHLAKRSRQMEVDGDLLDIQDAADELHARLEAIGIPDEIPGETGALTKKDERARWLQFAGGLLRRVEQWSEGMDGKYGGPFLRYVFQPIKDAADRYRTDRLEYRKKFQALVDNVAPLMTHQLIQAPELGYTFGKGHNGIGHAELLHAILHTGNESNKRKLLLGRQWAAENPDGTLDTSKWDAFIARLANTGVLQQAHFDFAQGVWDLMEETKPLAQKAHRDVFGRYFAEVTADSFVDPFGVTRRGGYVPAQADPAIVQDASIRALAESENENMAYSFPTTSKGFTKGRVEYNRPLKLDLRTIPQHLDKVLLFSHMEPAVRGVTKLLRQKTVSQPLGRIDPSAYDGMLLPWLNRSARQIVETPILGDGRTSRVLSALRSRAGAALMFANISNAVQQITGFSTAAVKVKPAHLMRGAAAMIAHPKQTREAVANASPYMAARMTNEVAAMSDAMNEILLNPSLYERAQAWSTRHSYFLQSALDNAMSPMIWTGAYNQALEEGMDERMAVRFADGVVRQTQGANAAEDVSRIETGPAYARIFTQFIGYFNMLANTNGTALKQIAGDMGLKKGAGKALGVVFYGMLAPIWVAEAIAQAFRGGPDDEDKDGYLDDWLAAVFGMGTIKGLLAQVPFVAQVGQVVVNRFNTNPADDRFSLSPAVSLLESAASVPHDVYKGITGEGNAQRTVRDAAALVSLATGLPATAVARPVGYLAGVAQGKVEPTGPVDMARGVVTGTASPESKQR